VSILPPLPWRITKDAWPYPGRQSSVRGPASSKARDAPTPPSAPSRFSGCAGVASYAIGCRQLQPESL
jgi:hypothetical protein